MADTLPQFRYHPDPRATGSVVATEAACACCGEQRGWTVRSHYGRVSYDSICPWCVADGSAAAKLGASFCGDISGDVAPEVENEIMYRTPGYESWQGEVWQTHCGDGCAFHGDLRDDIHHLPAEAEAHFLETNDWLDDWDDLKAAYAAGKSSTALYKFVCLHCGLWCIGIDFT